MYYTGVIEILNYMAYIKCGYLQWITMETASINIVHLYMYTYVKFVINYYLYFWISVHNNTLNVIKYLKCCLNTASLLKLNQISYIMKDVYRSLPVLSLYSMIVFIVTGFTYIHKYSSAVSCYFSSLIIRNARGCIFNIFGPYIYFIQYISRSSFIMCYVLGSDWWYLFGLDILKSLLGIKYNFS